MSSVKVLRRNYMTAGPHRLNRFETTALEIAVVARFQQDVHGSCRSCNLLLIAVAYNSLRLIRNTEDRFDKVKVFD